MSVGGDITEVRYNHPTVGSGVLFPKSNTDSTFEYGGFQSGDDENGIDGGGNMIDVINRIRASFEVTFSNDPLINNEVQKMKDLAASPVQADWTITHISGAVFTLKGKPVGNVQVNLNTTEVTLKVAGGNVMRKTA